MCVAHKILHAALCLQCYYYCSYCLSVTDTAPFKLNSNKIKTNAIEPMIFRIPSSSQYLILWSFYKLVLASCKSSTICTRGYTHHISWYSLPGYINAATNSVITMFHIALLSLYSTWPASFSNIFLPLCFQRSEQIELLLLWIHEIHFYIILISYISTLTFF